MKYVLVAYRGQYNTNEPDKMIEWARGKGWGFRGHCLFWDVEDDSHYPDWVKPLAGQDMVDAIYGRLESAVNHYRVRNGEFCRREKKIRFQRRNTVS